MLVKDLKQIMFLPEKEFLINKFVNIRGKDVLLISITSQEQRNVLWVMYQASVRLDEEIYSKRLEEYTSNRDQMLNRLNNSANEYRFFISEMTIQKQKMTFSSSTSSRIYNTPQEEYLLRHFIEKGITTTYWDEVDLIDIVIAQFEQTEEEDFPQIDLSKELDISLKISDDSSQVLIGNLMTLKFAEVEKDKKFYFYDSIQNKNRTFYINTMYHYDVWAEAYDFFNQEYSPDTREYKLQQNKDEYLFTLEKTCPKGMNLAMLEYETEDEVQLNFYPVEYLEEKPIRNGSSVSILSFKSGKEFGPNGYRSRICMIKPVPKDFDGGIDVELFSWYMKIPEENIKL
jgi:hypothetical protein